MELKVQRLIKSPHSTIGKFYIDGTPSFDCLEPTDRGLTSQMTLVQIMAIKVPDKTAIPTGRYQVTKYFSPKHNMDVPLVNNVPGYAGVEIHVGNFPLDTDGCLLLGTSTGPDEVLNSKAAIEAFYRQFFATIAAGEPVWITYL
jgi:hypothetical protein